MGGRSGSDRAWLPAHVHAAPRAGADLDRPVPPEELASRSHHLPTRRREAVSQPARVSQPFAALSPHGVIVESQSDRVPLEVPVRPGCGQWPDAQNRVLRDQNSTACRPARARFAGSTRLRVSHGEAPSNLLHQPLHSEREWPHPSQEASRLPVAAGEHTHVAPPAGICRPCPTRSSDLLLLHPVSERGRTGVFSDTEQHALCWIHLSTVPDLCASSTFAKSHRLTI